MTSPAVVRYKASSDGWLRFQRFNEALAGEGATMSVVTVEIINPSGVRAAKQSHLAVRRLADLHHVRIGLLDNNKPNADKFLAHFAERMQRRYAGLEFVAKRKMTRIESDGLKEFAERCDVVVNAFAD